MTPRQADPQVRDALVETAARLLAEGGDEYLTLRRLTEQVGTSTMAVYTHFGSMEELRSEVAGEAFARLRQRLRAVQPSSDPVADLGRLGAAYLANAMDDPNLYQAIFGRTTNLETVSAGYDTFMVLVDGVNRGIQARRFSPADPAVLATQLWAAIHGAIVLAHAGLFGPDELVAVVAGSARNLFVGFGDSPEAVEASFTTVVWHGSP